MKKIMIIAIAVIMTVSTSVASIPCSEKQTARDTIKIVLESNLAKQFGCGLLQGMTIGTIASCFHKIDSKNDITFILCAGVMATGASSGVELLHQQGINRLLKQNADTKKNNH